MGKKNKKKSSSTSQEPAQQQPQQPQQQQPQQRQPQTQQPQTQQQPQPQQQKQQQQKQEGLPREQQQPQQQQQKQQQKQQQQQQQGPPQEQQQQQQQPTPQLQQRAAAVEQKAQQSPAPQQAWGKQQQGPPREQQQQLQQQLQQLQLQQQPLQLQQQQHAAGQNAPQQAWGKRQQGSPRKQQQQLQQQQLQQLQLQQQQLQLQQQQLQLQQQQHAAAVGQNAPQQAWGKQQQGSPCEQQQQQQLQQHAAAVGQNAPQQAWGKQQCPAHEKQQQGPPDQQQRRQQRQQQQQQPTSQRQPPTRNVPVKVDDVVITKGVKGLNLKVPPRKNLLGGGTLGRRTTVETNHLALDISRAKNNRIIHYDVSVNPDKPKRLIRLVMEQFRSEHYPNRYPAFDGKKNLYSSGYLPFQTHISGTVVIQDEERRQPKEFEVTINFANMVNLDQLNTYMQNGSSQEMPMEVIQAVDIVLRQASATSKCFVQVGRSFFTPPSGRIIDMGEGLELWYGFYQSAILGWRPFVNIDVAHKGFPKQQTVVNLIGDLFHRDPKSITNLRPFEVDDLNKYLKTLKVDYELPGQPDTKRCYRVNRVVDSPSKLSFLLKNGQRMTVLDYFIREKRLRLQFPDLPCLDVGSPNRQSPIYVPVELCTIRSQVIVRKMNENQTSNMIKFAATSADDRKRKIMDALRKAGFNSSKTVQEFGFSVSDQFEKVSARILDAPMLAYREQTEKPVRGVWRAKHFLTGQQLQDWGILNMNGRYTQDDKLRSFCADMKRTGESLGMKIAPARAPCTIDCHPREVQHKLEDYLNHVKGIQLVVVVVPDRGDTYAKVKQAAELRVGVLTQCIRARTINRMNPSTISNILLKVNSKLNGVNHSLDNSARPPCLLKPVMIVGADVTHPSPDQTDIPSVAAVCASHDAKAFRYNIQYRLQGPREEIIRDLENIMKEHLMFFYRQTKLKPEKIIFYRDGVSEGQFAQVLNEELQAIRRACQSLNVEYQPNITFLVVQKRHHTRFFPLKKEDVDGKNGNVPPGTVVDTEITHPTETDFYLVSHASIQGTSRPTKYRKLWDDSDMSEDEVEQLTYYLCHMFSRCTRAVSYPTPTYYAHLAAYRARVYIEGQKIQLNNLLEEQRRRSIQEVICKGSPMFFV